MRHYDSRHIRILAPAKIMVVMSDVWWFVGLGVWSAAIVMAIKPLHGYLVNKGCEDMVAVYYNRKVAHMLAGGVPILASPSCFLFSRYLFFSVFRPSVPSSRLEKPYLLMRVLHF